MAAPGATCEDVGTASPKPENSTSQTAQGWRSSRDNDVAAKNQLADPEPEAASESKENDAREQMHVSSGSDDASDKGDNSTNRGVVARTLNALTWAPKRLRYDPENPPKFGYGLNILYALVSSHRDRPGLLRHFCFPTGVAV